MTWHVNILQPLSMPPTSIRVFVAVVALAIGWQYLNQVESSARRYVSDFVTIATQDVVNLGKPEDANSYTHDIIIVGGGGETRLF